MDPLVTLSAVSNLLNVVEVFGRQYRSLFPTPRYSKHLATNTKLDEAIVISKKGREYERITAQDIARLDEQSQRLIRALEKSMNANFERWTELYPTTAVAGGAEVNSAVKAALAKIARDMCADYQSILDYLHKIGKHSDVLYDHVRYICDQPSVLSKSEKKPTASDEEGGSAMSNITKIVVAAIGAAGLIIVGFLQFGGPKTPPPDPSVPYTGRVTDVKSKQPIPLISVSVETDQQVPQVQRTDSLGVFQVWLPQSTRSVRIRIDTAGYDVFERNVVVSRTGLEPIELTAKATPTPTPTPNKGRVTANSNQVIKGNENDIKQRERNANSALDRPPRPTPEP